MFQLGELTADRHDEGGRHLPQLTHYVLDGFLGRRRANPRVGTLL
jgi:hypothetical protein